MFKRLISSLVCLTFSFSNLQYVHGQDFNINQLPVPGTMVGESVPFAPLALKGLIVNPQKPLEFQFIVDTGKGPQGSAEVKDQANQLVKYFLAGLTIPEGDLWVNLSPYEKNRMVPTALGLTDLGRDFLAQDYILKQLTASLIYPENDLGKKFWARVYAKAQQQFGTTNVPVNTFNKVWILPNEAQVFENNNAAYVTKSTLKVMLDEDYTALQKHMPVHNGTDSIGSNIVRQIIIPEIEKEVNTGKNFATLRQIYQALILAKWYKETIQNGLVDALYTNKNKVAGVNLNDPNVKEQIYNRYLQAYKKGAFNYIKEDPTPDGQVMPRKYFSGGMAKFGTFQLLRTHNNKAMLAWKVLIAGSLLLLTVGCGVKNNSSNNSSNDTASQVQVPQVQSTDEVVPPALSVEAQDVKRIVEVLGRNIERQYPSQNNERLVDFTIFKISSTGGYGFLLGTQLIKQDAEKGVGIFDPSENLLKKGSQFLGSDKDAFTTLANFPSMPEYRPLILNILNTSSNRAVRVAALLALRRMPNKSLIPTLVKYTKDVDPDVRLAAVLALGPDKYDIEKMYVFENPEKVRQMPGNVQVGMPIPYFGDARVSRALSDYLGSYFRVEDVPAILTTLVNIRDTSNYKPFLSVQFADPNTEAYVQQCLNDLRRLSNEAMLSPIQQNQTLDDAMLIKTPKELDALKEHVDKFDELAYKPEEWEFAKAAQEAIKEIISGDLSKQLDEFNDMQLTLDLDIFGKLARKVVKGIQLLGSSLGKNKGKIKNGAVIGTIITEELAFDAPSIALAEDVTSGLTGYAIDELGTQEQREKFITPMLEGNSPYIVSFAITEEKAGSASWTGASAIAEFTGYDGGKKMLFDLTGAKQFITMGTKATHIMFLAITDKVAHEKNVNDGVTFFLVPMDRMGASRIKQEMTTYRGSGTAFIFADNVVLTEDDILGGKDMLNRAKEVYTKVLNSGRISISSIAIGGLSRLKSDMFDKYRSLLVDKNTPKTVLDRYEEELLTLTAHTYGDRLLLLDAARKRDEGKSFDFEATLTKLMASGDEVWHNTWAFSLFGQEAIRYGDVRNRNFRNGKLDKIGEGTSEIMRLIITNKLRKKGMSYEDAVRVLMQDENLIIPANVHESIISLIKLYEENKGNRSRDLNRIFLERVQRDIADLIAYGRRLELVQNEVESKKEEMDAQLTARLVKILEQELDQMSAEFFNSAREMFNTDLTFHAVVHPENIEAWMVPDVRPIYLPRLHNLTGTQKDDFDSIERVVIKLGRDIEDRLSRKEQLGSIIDHVIKGLSESDFIGLDYLREKEPTMVPGVQNMILSVLAHSNLSLATAYLEQQKALAALEPFAEPEENGKINTLIREIKGGKRASVILQSLKNNPVTYTPEEPGNTESFILKGTGSMVIGGAEAEAFVVMAVDKNGKNPRMFVLDKNQEGVESKKVERTLGLGGAGFADVTFTGAFANALVKEGKTTRDIFKTVMDIEYLGFKARGIEASLRIAEETVKYSEGRLQSIPMEVVVNGKKEKILQKVPNSYYEQVWQMMMQIVERTEAIAKLDVNKPKDLQTLMRLMVLNGDEGVQIFGGAGLDGEQRVNEIWRDLGTLLALYGSDRQLEEEMSDRAMNSGQENISYKNNKTILLDEKGGIDLNKINIKRTGHVIKTQFDQAQLSALEHGGFEGFTPDIISMTRISSPLPLLGINVTKPANQ